LPVEVEPRPLDRRLRIAVVVSLTGLLSANAAAVALPYLRGGPKFYQVATPPATAGETIRGFVRAQRPGLLEENETFVSEVRLPLSCIAMPRELSGPISGTAPAYVMYVNFVTGGGATWAAIATRHIDSLLGQQLIAIASRPLGKPFDEVKDLHPLRPIVRILAVAPVTQKGLGGILIAD
jgi:hypothetical protein